MPSKSGVRCQYKVSGEVRIGTEIFWAGMTVDSGEHEGISHRGEEAVIARLTKDGGLGPIHVLKQFDKVVEDAFSSIKMRRHLSAVTTPAELRYSLNTQFPERKITSGAPKPYAFDSLL